MPSRIGDALHWYATYTPEKVAIISGADRKPTGSCGRVCVVWRTLSRKSESSRVTVSRC